MSNQPIRTLIVDDSALVRTILTRSLAPFPRIQIVGSATNPYEARDKILELTPDVMTLDIDMPRMDGITFLKLIMKHHPMPVIIFSSQTHEGSAKALEALHAGAADVLGKPSGASSAFEDGAVLAERIVAVAQTKFRRVVLGDAPLPVVVPRPAPSHRRYSPRQLILMGASTGGTEALKTVLTGLRADLPPICIVQHIPAYFSKCFADRLNELCSLEVLEASGGEKVQSGRVLIAPGGHHVILKWHATHYTVELSDLPKVHYQRPAVDVLFESAVRAGAAPHSMAVLLTGMGTDGADGMLKLRQGGATTIAQDEKTSLVFGMPRAALERGGAQKAVALEHVASTIETYATNAALKSAAA